MIDLNNLGKGKKSYKKKVEPPKVVRTHYMPDEDEVYIGAEFILRHRKTGKTKIDIYNGHISPKLYLSRAGISVIKKYLDKEDIKSLGFTETEPYRFTKDQVVVYYRQEGEFFYPIDIQVGEQTYNFLKVKSKDDLKRVLKMLNI